MIMMDSTSKANKEGKLRSEQSTITEMKDSREDEEVILHPSPDDVLMGRGAPSTDFTGNLRFRELVKERRSDYVNAKRRKDKQGVAGEIIATVKSRGGRFLQRTETHRKAGSAGETKSVTVWQPVEDRKTLLVKVKQLMRDVGPTAQAKRNLRREMRRQKELDALAGDSTDEEEDEAKPKLMDESARTMMGTSTGSNVGLPIYRGGMSPRGVPSPGQMHNYPMTVAQLMSPVHTNQVGMAEEASLRQSLQQEATTRQFAALRHEMQLRRELQLRQELQQQRQLQQRQLQQREAFLREKEATLSASQRSDGSYPSVSSMPLNRVNAATFAAQRELILRQHQMRAMQGAAGGVAMPQQQPPSHQQALRDMYLSNAGGGGLDLTLTGTGRFPGGVPQQQQQQQQQQTDPNSLLAVLLRQRQGEDPSMKGPPHFPPQN